MITVDFELINAIRKHINRTEKQAELLANRKKWMRITAALDVLEDTSWAIEYYIATEYPDSTKGKYLFTYGVLQALFVQGDAIKSIFVSLFGEELDFKERYPKVYAVREMRDDVTGHPTNRRNSQYIYLAQISLTKDHFYYIKQDSNDMSTDSIHVNLMESIEDVAHCINDVLSSAVRDLDKEYEEYILKHKDRKMRRIFDGLSYAKEKIDAPPPLSDWAYSKTKEMVSACEKELVARYGSVEAVDSYKYLLDEIHDIFSLIDDGLKQVPFELEAKFEKYIIQLLFIKLEELESYCRETDEYFENNGTHPKQLDSLIAIGNTTDVLNAFDDE